MNPPTPGQRGAPSPRSARAFTRAELLAVITAISLLAAVVWPALGNETLRAQRAVCSNNLSRIGQALTSWAADHDELYPWQVFRSAGGTRYESSRPSDHFRVLFNEVKTPTLFACPSDREKAATTGFDAFSDSYVSYLLAHPDLGEGRAILSGDRNIDPTQSTEGCVEFSSAYRLTRPATNTSWSARIHARRGHLLFNDGSVESTDDAGLRAFLSPAGASNNFHFITPGRF